MSSVSAKQNVHNVNRFLRNLVLLQTGPIFGSAKKKKKDFTVLFVANFNNTKSFGSSWWVMQSKLSSQSSYSVNFSISWVVKSKSDISDSVNIVFQYALWLPLRFGIGSPTWFALGASILNTLLIKCQSQNSWFFPSAVHHLCLGGVQPLDISKPTDLALRTQGSLFPTHKTGGALKFSLIRKSISYKWPSTRIFKPN